MTLTTRLLIFFLSMLAFVLVSFSSALYILADNYLHRQVTERLAMVLNTIGAAIEVGPGGVEWELMDRQQRLRVAAFDEQVVWLVADDNGHMVAQSISGDTERFFQEVSPSLPLAGAGLATRRWIVGFWEVGQQWIVSGQPQPERRESSSAEKASHYRALSVTAGVSLLPMQATLSRLAFTLCGLSAAIWILAFVAGRFVCRRALAPVQRMAIAAGEINADDLTQRLPALTSNDELEGLSRAFNQLLDRLQQAFEQQREFTGDASHQLRTPLTAILGQVDVALRRERSGDEYRQVLETVRLRATHLTRMVEALLFLARANAEAQTPALELLNLKTWLPRHLENWSGHPRFEDISAEGPDAETLNILAQPTLLAELLDILLDNACKYSQPETPIKLRARQSEDTISVNIEDAGCGLEEDERVRVFEPFCRSPEARRRGIEGVGLGLSIAKRLSALFGGDLTVVSQPGQGSKFTLSFPVATVNHAGHSSSLSPRKPFRPK